MTRTAALAFIAIIVVVCCAPALARAQNPVQWSGSVTQSVARASEQSLPLLFWVTGGRDADDDLSDAQSACFRDPVVVGIIRKCFVPVRVSRTSRVLAEAERLGLPTQHGLYCAVLTSDGRLLDQMGPGEVADPPAFASHLTRAYAQYCNELYERELRPLLEDLNSPKPQARTAVQTVWRLGIKGADKALVGLLARTDLQPTEVSRLYELFAALGTQTTIGALLDRAEDKAAVAALARVEPGAMEWLLPDLPTEEGPVTARQMAAYRGVLRASGMMAPKAEGWWEKAKPEDRRKELDRVRTKAEAVLDYWRQQQAPQ